MWLDPDDDPRNSEGVSPDGELPTLLDYTAHYRMTLLMKCDGLTVEQLARRSVPPSTMSLLGLLRHIASAERDWRNWITPGDPLPKLYGVRDADFDGAIADEAVLAGAYADLAREQADTDAALADIPIWASGSAETRSPSVRSTSTGSRSTPGTAVTPTCSGSASTAGWVSSDGGPETLSSRLGCGPGPGTDVPPAASPARRPTGRPSSGRSRRRARRPR